MIAQEIFPRIDLAQPFVYQHEFTLSANSGNDSTILVFGHSDFFCTHRTVKIIDTAGIIVGQNSTEEDLLTIEFKDQDGKNLQNNPIDITSLNVRIGNPSLEGWFIANRTELTINVAGKTFPSAAKLTFPLKVEVQFHGYNLLAPPQIK